ncbi:DNA ligase, partial [Patescibacteria group bacterium]
MNFSKLALYFQQLENTASRIEMTEILSEIFSNANARDIGSICYLLLGRVAPRYESVEFGVASKLMIRAIAEAYDTEMLVVEKAFRSSGDLGEAAFLVSKIQNITSKQDVSIQFVFEALQEITQASGTGSQEVKISKIAELISHVDELSAKYIVRIPLEKMRLGFSDMTILDGLSWMLVGDKSLRTQLEIAYNARPDIGYI